MSDKEELYISDKTRTAWNKLMKTLSEVSPEFKKDFVKEIHEVATDANKEQQK